FHDADLAKKTDAGQIQVAILIEITDRELTGSKNEFGEAIGIICGGRKTALAIAAEEGDSRIGKAGDQVCVAIAIKVGSFHGEQMGWGLVCLHRKLDGRIWAEAAEAVAQENRDRPGGPILAKVCCDNVELAVAIDVGQFKAIWLHSR